MHLQAIGKGASILTLAAVVSLGLPGCGDDSSDGKRISFPNLVAAGDVTDTSAVLWAHASRRGDVTFEYSTDPSLDPVIGSQVATVLDPMVPVKVKITGLVPATQYYYRARMGKTESIIGKFRTPAQLGSLVGLRFGVSGDWRGDLSPYPAIANALGRDLDFFISLGDTVYADMPSPDLPADAYTVEEYRIAHNEVYSEREGLNALGELRAATAILAMIDDHEVVDDFSGGAPPGSDSRFDPCATTYINECDRFLNGLQAFQEYNPVEDLFYGDTGDPRTANKRKLYRARTYGSDAAILMVDERSFRDEPLAPVDPTNPLDVIRFLQESFTPGRTFLGAVQVADLKADLLQAETDGIVWKFVIVPGAIQNLGVVAAPDRYEGYAAERTEILEFIDVNSIRNVVFIAADLHGTIVNDLSYQLDFNLAQNPVNAFEISTGAVAFYKPFGPTVVEIACNLGLLSPAECAFYDSLSTNLKDNFVRQLIDGHLDDLMQGYPHVGLGSSPINATLIQGDYIAVHVYGWTEFDVDPSTQELTVTTYGIEPYSGGDLVADPADILSRVPAIVSQFRVTPQ